MVSLGLCAMQTRVSLDPRQLATRSWMDVYVCVGRLELYCRCVRHVVVDVCVRVLYSVSCTVCVCELSVCVVTRVCAVSLLCARVLSIHVTVTRPRSALPEGAESSRERSEPSRL